MELRKYEPKDCQEITELFYQTVHTVNVKDYSNEQCQVWATGNVNLEQWNKSFLEHTTIVAIENNQIIGFGDIDETGYLDRLYVHKDYQRRKVATAICDYLEKANPFQVITTHASITARPFFEQRGYEVVKEQQVERRGILLTNYVMEKKHLKSK